MTVVKHTVIKKPLFRVLWQIYIAFIKNSILRKRILVLDQFNIITRNNSERKTQSKVSEFYTEMFVVSSLVKFDKAELNSANLSLLSDVMLMKQARDRQMEQTRDGL